MAETKTKDTTKKIPEEIVEKTREIFLAGLGLFATVEEEGSALFNKFLEKGKEFTRKGEELEKKGKEFTSEKKEELSKRFDEFYKSIETRIRSTLENIGISSRDEIKELEEKVDKLAERLAAIEEKLDQSVKTGAKTTRA